MTSIRAAITLFGLLVVVVSFGACGGDDDEVGTLPTVTVVQDTAPAPTPELQSQPQPSQPLDETASPAEDGIISIDARDTLFAPNRWTMSIGEPVTIRVANADSQEHNLRIAGLDGAYDTDDDALTEPNPLAGGVSGELTFVPLVPGDYTFRCDFHPGTMGGQIEVEPALP
jgi:plastocyanin